MLHTQLCGAGVRVPSQPPMRAPVARPARLPDRCRKLLNLRLFENSDTGRAWDQSVKDCGGEVPVSAKRNARGRRRLPSWTILMLENDPYHHKRVRWQVLLVSQFTLFGQPKGAAQAAMLMPSGYALDLCAACLRHRQ